MPKRNLRLLGFARQMRQDPTPAEEILWRELRRKELGHRFRRQEPIGPYIVDFVCKQRRLVIETDGDSHTDPERDRARDRELAAMAYRVVRFDDGDIRNHTDDMIGYIADILHGEA